MSGGCEENAAGSLFKVHGHGCAAAFVNPGSAADGAVGLRAAPGAPAEVGSGLSAAVTAVPVPPRRGGLVLPSPGEQSPGVTSHLPNATAQGERSRLLKCRGTTHCRERTGSGIIELAIGTGLQQQ